MSQFIYYDMPEIWEGDRDVDGSRLIEVAGMCSRCGAVVFQSHHRCHVPRSEVEPDRPMRQVGDRKGSVFPPEVRREA